MTLLWGSQCEVRWKNCFPSVAFIYNYTLFLSLTVLLSGLSGTMGAPVESEESWWMHPCSGQTQIRHARSGNRPLNTQLKVFSIVLNKKVLKDLEVLYNTQPGSRMSSQCPRIKAVLNIMRDPKYNVKMTNYIFYNTIVELANFVNTLKNIRVKTDGKLNIDNRTQIFQEIEDNLRKVLCEFNETLELSPLINDKLIRGVVNKIRNRLITTKCLPDQAMSYSKAQILDIDVVKNLKRFFNQVRIIRNKKRAKNSNKIVGNSVSREKGRKRQRKHGDRKKERTTTKH